MNVPETGSPSVPIKFDNVLFVLQMMEMHFGGMCGKFQRSLLNSVFSAPKVHQSMTARSSAESTGREYTKYVGSQFCDNKVESIIYLQ